MPDKNKVWNDWPKSGLDVQDWDGGNIESDAPRLNIREGIVVGVLIAGAIALCVPVVFYDWWHGGGRRG